MLGGGRSAGTVVACGGCCCCCVGGACATRPSRVLDGTVAAVAVDSAILGSAPERGRLRSRCPTKSGSRALEAGATFVRAECGMISGNAVVDTAGERTSLASPGDVRTIWNLTYVSHEITAALK